MQQEINTEVSAHKTAQKEYSVTIIKRHPTRGEEGGLKYTTTAKNRAQAIRYIRRQATDDGHIGQGQGRYTIFATEIEGI